ncbi:MAG: hypothetical protein ABI182_08765, partial [Candidatus Baltobacteraceae bacterium]
MRSNTRTRLAILASSLIVLGALAIALFDLVPGHIVMGDYRAFYCAGRAVQQHENPYQPTVLSACESERVPAPLFSTKPGEVLPAPLPGYLAAAFVPLALLPFGVSALLFALISILAIAFAIAGLAKLGLGSPWVLAAIFAMPLAAISLPFGELPPIALAGIVLVALAVRRDSRRIVVVGLALAMVEPQVGLAVAFAL